VNPDDYADKAQSYLKTLCSVKPNRRTGSAGNLAATAFFADTLCSLGCRIDVTPFDCLDYRRGRSSLTHTGIAFEVHSSPYSLGCDLSAELVAVSTLEELENVRCQGQILLMLGEICAEQLMPKNFVFYNPEHHKKIIALLEERAPAALITATAENPEQVGALYPYPLIVDGDFDIPSLHCRDSVGEVLSRMEGETFHLKIDGQRIPSIANNVITRLNPRAEQKVVLTAHIDAYEDTPGASDNASGTVVLLLLAEMLSGYQGKIGIEIAALNGEDHYSAAGQLDYLKRYGAELDRVLLAVNIDDVGYRQGGTTYSCYECPAQLQHSVAGVLAGFDGLLPGDPWFNGDHMIFVQNGVPALAFTSESMPELMRTVTHTALDTPEILEPRKLVEVAASLNALLRSL
jgi:aminopeptidase YwaD